MTKHHFARIAAMAVTLVCGMAASAVPAVAAPSKLEQTATWFENHGVVLGKVVVDLGEIGVSQALVALDSQQFVGKLHNDCVKLRTDVAAAQALPPIPYITAQHDLKTSLGELRLGADACVEGTAIGEKISGQLMKDAEKAWALGTTELTKAENLSKQ